MTADEATQTVPVAVVIAAYNRRDWVGRAVASALAQRPLTPAEVIVVDDGSDDDTAQAARAAGAQVVVLPSNRGAAAARNAGAAATAQPWIAPLDSDDEWLPDMLSALWPLRDGHALVAGASVALRGGRAVGFGGVLSTAPVRLSSPAALVYPENFIAASGVIVRRDAFMAVGGYREELRQAEDLDLWLRILSDGHGLCVPRVVTRYFVHDAQKSQRGEHSRRAVLDIIERYRDQPWCGADLIERRRAVMAWDALREAMRARDHRSAAAGALWLVRSPRRLRAVGAIILRRRASRARVAALPPSE